LGEDEALMTPFVHGHMDPPIRFPVVFAGVTAVMHKSNDRVRIGGTVDILKGYVILNMRRKLLRSRDHQPKVLYERRMSI